MFSFIKVLLLIRLAAYRKVTFVYHLNFTVLYLVLSLVITTISTTLIAYRIIDVVRRSSKPTPYSPTIEILVESGAMYTILNIICCALRGPLPQPNVTSSSRATAAGGILYSLLIPVTVSQCSVSVIYNY